MRKRNILIILALLFAIGAFLIWRYFLKAYLPSPGSKIPTASTGIITKPAPNLVENFYAGVNMYLSGPDVPVTGMSRLELTLVKAEVVRNDAKTFTVFEGATKLIVEKGISQKALNVLMPAGPYGKLILTFLPTASLVAVDGKPQTAFLPNRTVTIDMKETVPESRTLTSLVHLDLDQSRFGIKSGVPTYQLPPTLEAEKYLLGGIFKNDNAIGSVWQLTKPTLATVVQRDLNLNIAPKQELPGTPGYTPPTAPPQPAP